METPQPFSSPNSPNSPDASNSSHSVSIWESIAIALGAVALVTIGLMGLGVKALNNAYDPERAEAIARSVITYTIPGGAKGLFGANVGGAKVAIVASNRLPPGVTLPPAAAVASPPPAIELLVARIPVSQETEEINPEEEVANQFFSGFSFSYQTEGVFQVVETHTTYGVFCGVLVPMTVQQGRLILPDQSTTAAAKYEMRVDRETSKYIAILTAVGEDAEEKANAVLQSLQCQD